MLENLMFRPIIKQPGTYTSNAAQVISEYLYVVVINTSLGMQESLLNYCNSKSHYYQTQNIIKYKISNTYLPLYNPYLIIKQTIDYIIDEIYVKKKLPKICSKLIFEHLLLK